MFVDREQGKVVSIFAREQYPGQEQLPDDHPDIATFKNQVLLPPNNQEIRAEIARLSETDVAIKGLLQAIEAEMNDIRAVVVPPLDPLNPEAIKTRALSLYP